MAFNRKKALAAAARYTKLGQDARAARELAAVVEHDPDDIRSWLLLAAAVERTGDTAAAVTEYLKIANSFIAKGQPRKAIAVYDRVLTLDPARLEIQQRAAELYAEIGRADAAITTLEHLANTYFQAGENPRGFACLERVVELDPDAVGRRLRLAELYSREQLRDKAVEHFRAAADRLLYIRRLDEYVRVAERLLYHQDDLPVMRTLARTYLEKREARRALVKVNALLRAAPNDPGGLELLAETFLALGKHEKAVLVATELGRAQRGANKAVEAKRAALRALRAVLQRGRFDDKTRRTMDEQLSALDGELRAAMKSNEVSVVVELDEVGAEEIEIDVEELELDDFEELDASADAAENQRIVDEARVYTDYKMYQHALRHVEGLLKRAPRHAEALALRSEIRERMRSAGQAPLLPPAPKKPVSKKPDKPMDSISRLDAMLSGLNRLPTKTKPKG